MRLREMKEILEENVTYLEVDAIDQGGSKYEIKDYNRMYLAIKNIEGFGFIKDDLKILENMSTIFHDKSERVIVDSNGLNQLRDVINKIKSKVITVILAIREALPDQNENSVSIKLPSIYTDLSQVSGFIKEIDMILKQTLVKQYQGTVKLQNFDTGTNWIEIILHSAEAVVFLGTLVKNATNLALKEYLNFKKTMYTINTLAIEEGAKEQVLKALENAVNHQAKLYASALIKEFNINENVNEYHTNLTHSIEKFAELISKGTEVHSALNAPQETKEAFPDLNEARNFIESSIKLITDGSSNEEEK